MPRFDASTSTCRIRTRRTGVLSAVGHDLEIDVANFSIDADQERLEVRARFDATSLRVLGAVQHGRLNADQLSPSERAQIEQHIADDVLRSHRFPEVVFQSSSVDQLDDGYRVRGELSLRGVARPLTIMVDRNGDRLIAEIVIHQPDFGIKPFRALGGALKVHADVLVTFTAPALGR
jgi:polyisoprenoid-binding protein YceI